MKLSIRTVNVRHVKLGTETTLKDGILYLNKAELKDLLMDGHFFKDIEIDVVRPGESVRIVKVSDVIEPRAKVGLESSDFPGVLSKIRPVGHGISLALKGISVVLVNQMPKKEVEFIDMFGLGSELSIYGKLNNIIINPIPLEGLEWEEYQYASKVAALKTSVYLAKTGENDDVDKIEVYDLKIPPEENMDLFRTIPKIAYYFQIHAKQFSINNKEPIFYGHNLQGFLPTIVHPNEVLDGALIRGFIGSSMETYSIQNNPVIKALYNEHGKKLLFMGVVLGVSNLDEHDRERSAVIAANLFSNILNANGVILTKAYGGASHTDIERVAEICEEKGIKTVLLTEILTDETNLEEGVLINSEKLDALINLGFFNQRSTFPPANRVIGASPFELIHEKPVSGEINPRLRLLTGATSQLGESSVIAVQF